LNFAEGGQSSTGSIIRWAKRLFGETDYAQLDREAALINPGSDGLVALETFQGSRTPVTDPLARGALVGLTLKHTRAHIWRALMEAVCFGTRACVQGLAQAGHEADEIIIAGGAVRSNLWLQMHA
jgi:sugar (pentulose or hexulose) kinase